jgi:lysophospholipase L1-like esterase
MIVNCGMPGDTIKNISKIIKNQNLKNAFKSSYSKPWKLMFMSGGGNDLIDEAGNIIKKRKARKQKAYNDVAKYCDDKKLQKLLSNISSGYNKIIKLRDGPNSKAKNIPIIAHTYAYPTPRNSPATFLSAPISGPWLYKVMVQAKIPEEHWLPLTDYLFNNLADTIADLKNTLPNFHVVDTRDLLTRAKLGVTGNSYDWMNEIHPNSGGYRKIARELDALADNFL